ncbi:hypothetical protein ADK67_21815 [Saccharothrix sp. NRRL B-16348]|uniref:class I SAM-dependent methyltransferase n=1 Tax=Saccharothrix sp. NRRL B-16348 TaxID=1415542 RepID=UPI0006AEE573|nr:class I SAM-dependent methyltransferase [Saccharothrix sp. NRRL B-16348]KOX23234.1 hypothetical protein ADK67_21815 [Saccharothrix sp. NRRL B-16348]
MTKTSNHLESRGGRRFARNYESLAAEAERRWIGPLRGRMLNRLRGHVLEVGAGAGANLPFYSEDLDLVAVEPSSTMRAQFVRNAEKAGRQVKVVDATAERLPFDDDSFDAVVCTLVLCSIADLDEALDEIRRVLKPGGELVFLEHVRASGRVAGALQDLVTPMVRRIAFGCRPNSRSVDAMARHGFLVEIVDRLPRPWPRYPTNSPYLIGIARPAPSDR